MAYSSIAKPTDYFNTILYTGNTSGQSITGVGFQPDFLWIKSRSASYQHSLRNVIAGSTKTLRSNGTNAEATQSDSVTSFDSDGFTLGADSSSFVNENSATYVGWNWKAGGAASSNGDGSIASSVSANTTSGVSIVTYTGTGSSGTIGHGLGVAPKIVLFIKRSDTSNRYFYTYQIDGSSDELGLNLTEGKTDRSLTAPTSSVFYVDNQSERNASGANQLAYVFAEVKGFSKFGTYIGNGNAAGTFVYTGFKPAWILLKQSSANGAGWRIHDNKRGILGNPEDETLYASSANAESTGRDVDFLSNGFKLRTDSGDGNSSGSTYIYMAFAENPFVANDSGTAVPVVAR